VEFPEIDTVLEDAPELLDKAEWKESTEDLGEIKFFGGFDFSRLNAILMDRSSCVSRASALSLVLGVVAVSPSDSAH
jgi:hypothetical protein